MPSPRRQPETISLLWNALWECKEFAMNVRLNTPPVCLAKSQAVTLTDARGAEIKCRSGALWITQDHDQRDIVLQAGESFTLDRGDPAIVWALAASSVEVLPARRPGRLPHNPGRQIFRRFIPWPQQNPHPSLSS
jgi:hypothetical protein